jgi:deglycase
MPNQLKGRKVAFLATDGVERVERVELTAPWNALKQAGAEVVLVAMDERRLDKMVEQSFRASDPLPGPIALG